jgi:hypothetical protein
MPINHQNTELWIGKQGLNFAIGICKDYYYNNAEIPDASDLEPINRMISRGLWDEFLIYNWVDFLKKCNLPVIFDGKQLKIDWKHEISLEYAVLKIRRFFYKYKRSPRTRDFDEIYSVIYTGLWKSKGISSWNQFLSYCDLPKNRGNKWIGSSGLLIALNLLREFKVKYNRDPSITDFKNIFYQLNVGVWNEFGIQNWNDLLEMTNISLDNYYKEVTNKINKYHFNVRFEFST